MREIKPEELKEILDSHEKWVEDAKCGECADLSYVNLISVNLMDVNLISANLSYANLRKANLMGANLMGVNLSYADLSYADLIHVDLRYADLTSADLSGGNLTGVNLSGVNLRNADLTGVKLRYANGNMKEVKTIKAETYAIVYTDTVMQIGCENHSIKDWFEFDDDIIVKMGGKKALKFWRKWKPILKLIIEK